mmetsp:Transcript_1045/g.3523  ORF Transcript_1045/g.3523 Transcript_1045/m.3523 type:complete len:234 (-) Transcript_1045:13-714(-)
MLESKCTNWSRRMSSGSMFSISRSEISTSTCRSEMPKKYCARSSWDKMSTNSLSTELCLTVHDCCPSTTVSGSWRRLANFRSLSVMFLCLDRCANWSRAVSTILLVWRCSVARDLRRFDVNGSLSANWRLNASTTSSASVLTSSFRSSVPSDSASSSRSVTKTTSMYSRSSTGSVSPWARITTASSRVSWSSAMSSSSVRPRTPRSFTSRAISTGKDVHWSSSCTWGSKWPIA